MGQMLDAARLEAWRQKAEAGHYLRPLLHIYLIWDPLVHHRITGKTTRRTFSWSLSTKISIERSRREHEELVAEFESLLVGIESTMQASDLGPKRLTDQELFLETKRALNPVDRDHRRYTPGEDHLEYRSARQQLANVSIVDETDSYLNVSGLLYSFVSLKELPDATFPGILREPELVRTTVEHMRLLADEKKLSLRIEASDAIQVEGDQSRLQQVVVNLLDNAIKYTPEGGSVTVSVHGEAETAVLTVSDTGIGISEGAQEHIFERFYRTDKARSRRLGGTGLGLSIVKSIGAAHGGQVSVQSAEGRGTTFRFAIPRLKDDEARTATSEGSIFTPAKF